jgi:serine/threonine protein kinase
MEGLYESKKYIYIGMYLCIYQFSYAYIYVFIYFSNRLYLYLLIVMEMLKGGELFERIVGRPRFSEEECAKLIRPLLESVAYIHDLGIVHRDLKPGM